MNGEHSNAPAPVTTDQVTATINSKLRAWYVPVAFGDSAMTIYPLNCSADGKPPGMRVYMADKVDEQMERLTSELYAAWNALNEIRHDAAEAEHRAFSALDEEIPIESPRSLEERQRSSSTHDAGSNPAGDANIATWEEVDHFMSVCRRWLNRQESNRIDRLIAAGKHEYVDCPKGSGCTDCIGWKDPA